MDIQQEEITLWARRTFPGQSTESIIRHLLSEAVELACVTLAAGEIQAIVDDAIVKVGKRERRGEMIMAYEEVADVTILALTLAGYSGFSLKGAVEMKMERNRKRTWGEANTLGFHEHITEPR